MAERTSPAALRSLLDGNSPFALIDVREAGEYNSSHIPGSSLIPRRQLESRMPAAAPCQGASLVLCDDDGRRAELAGATLERMGYTRVSILEGGINRWTTQGYPTQWGTNV
ncbi:MAG: rhodanese-like domain-containing protein, partial [Dehalococcoidia bacterium]|nr:rhodanese-like domain-containing protein [Dehalococcoidia bacterium]